MRAATASTVPFGSTAMRTTRVGLGAWAIGGLGARMAWGPQDDADSVATIRHAVQVGVNWIDTAPMYGLGHAKEVIGKVLRDFPEEDRPYVFTKCGCRWDDDATVTRTGDPRSIQWEVEQSLRRLGVDRIDLFQVHWPAADGTPIEVYWQKMVELRDQGVVAAIGLSNHDAEQLERAWAIGRVDAVQPPFSAIHRSAAAEVIPWAEAHGVAVIGYSPMQSGLLSGGFDAGRVSGLPASDWRRSHADFTGEGLVANLVVAAALRDVAERHGVSPAAAAISWTLAFRGVTGAIVGARRPEQVDDWLAAGDLELDAEDLASVEAAILAGGAGEGPTHP